MASIKIFQDFYLCDTDEDRDINWPEGTIAMVKHATLVLKYYKLTLGEFLFVCNHADAPSSFYPVWNACSGYLLTNAIQTITTTIQSESLPSIEGQDGKFLKVVNGEKVWIAGGDSGYDGDPTVIVQDATHRFHTDAKATEWDTAHSHSQEAHAPSDAVSQSANYTDQEVDAIASAVTTALSGKSNTSHSHAINDVTDLQTTLDGKAASAHNHDAAYEAKNANIQSHIAAAHAPSNAQKNSDITKAEIEAKLTGAITSHSHVVSDVSGLQAVLDGKAATLGADDNYVTDAEKTKISNLSGTNSGDNATNNQYSGLAASKQNVISLSGNTLKFMRCNAGETAIEFVALAGGGDMVGSNNLSEITNRQTALNNLGIYTKKLANDFTRSDTALAKVTELDQVCGVGTWQFEYHCMWQTSATATGIKLGVNHSGTVTRFVVEATGFEATTAASAGAQTAVHGAFGLRAGGQSNVISTSASIFGPTSVAVQNTDHYCIIRGLIVVTVSGNLELYFGSEATGSTQTLELPSSLILTKIS